ncbi:MAG: hypothetical protein NT129_03910 [Candidatus Aenigmarchaeota archaeon]|nr:hypothetical protein [Candidatus Aenigmarchaeota archaeon]
MADIDFVQVLDKTDDLIEELAMGRPPRERINPNNPILHLYMGVDLKRLKYDDVVGDAHIFEVEYFPEGDLPCSEDIFFNDGNNELYNLYKGPLKQAGFKIE